jgi:hypothetical protein
LKGYREVFRPEPAERRDPGRIFYTITDGDVGKRFIKTTADDIHVRDILGVVQRGDVGRRLYRVPTDGGIEGQPVTWIWQAESASASYERINGKLPRLPARDAAQEAARAMAEAQAEAADAAQEAIHGEL